MLPLNSEKSRLSAKIISIITISLQGFPSAMARVRETACYEPTPDDFLRLRTEGLSIQAIAEQWHFATRDSVYSRIKKWVAAGLLPCDCSQVVKEGRIRAKNGRIVEP
jgi:hypothetical protein